MVGVGELFLYYVFHLPQLEGEQVVVAVGEVEVAVIPVGLDADYVFGVETVGFVYGVYQ